MLILTEERSIYYPEQASFVTIGGLPRGNFAAGTSVVTLGVVAKQ